MSFRVRKEYTNRGLNKIKIETPQIPSQKKIPNWSMGGLWRQYFQELHRESAV